jgi:hypothetical protein
VQQGLVKRTNSRHESFARAWRVVVVVFGIAALALAMSAPAVAKTSSKPKALAHLKILKPYVTIKAAGKGKGQKATNGQVLHQGDELITDAGGIAEINYTDGSLTRLGNSTTFTITTLTNKKGGRQTEGTLGVGETWNRAAKVSQTGSFQVKAGGTTAAVEGTAFVFICQIVNSQLVCNVIAIVDSVNVTSPGGSNLLGPADGVGVTGDVQGQVTQYTYEQLIAIAFITDNLTYDHVEGKGGLGDLPAPTTTTTTTTTTTPPARPAGTTTTVPPPPVTVAPTTPPTTTIPPTTTTRCNTNLC